MHFQHLSIPFIDRGLSTGRIAISIPNSAFGRAIFPTHQKVGETAAALLTNQRDQQGNRASLVRRASLCSTRFVHSKLSSHIETLGRRGRIWLQQRDTFPFQQCSGLPLLSRSNHNTKSILPFFAAIDSEQCPQTRVESLGPSQKEARINLSCLIEDPAGVEGPVRVRAQWLGVCKGLSLSKRVNFKPAAQLTPTPCRAGLTY